MQTHQANQTYLNPTKYNSHYREHFLSTLLILFIFSIMNTAIAGGRTSEPNLMDSFLQQQLNSQALGSVQGSSADYVDNNASSTDSVNNNALVFSRGDDGVNVADFNRAFSLNKTLTKIRNTANETANNNSNAQLLSSLFNALTTTSKTNGFVNMSLQARNQEVNLNSTDLINGGMLPTAVFNRFDLSASDGKHCGEYRIVYHKASGTGRFFLIFEAKYPNPQPNEGSAGCFAVADFWQKVGQKTKADALIALEKFFYRGLEHAGVSLTAAVNFTHYTQETGQVRSNQFVDGPWQLREFKTDINATGKVVFTTDTVKDNPLTELFTNQQNSDSDALKAAKIYFNNDFSKHYIDNLLTPERRSNNPNSTNIINGFSLGNDNQYNEFQSNSSNTDNTARPNNTTLDTAISKKLSELNLSTYTPQMIRNRAEAMSCGGCHQNSNRTEIAPNVRWPNSSSFVHVNEQGRLSSALNGQFLPTRASLLENYLQETRAQRCGPACQLGSASSVGGYRHACAIQTDDTFECWGSNGGLTIITSTGLTAKQIAIGRFHVCVLKSDNTVACRGDNQFGQLDIPAGLTVKQITSGGGFSCALKLDNSVECWGRNTSGQLNVPIDLRAKQIAASSNHICALKLDNNAECWGFNNHGQLDVPIDLRAKQVALGLFHTCALKLDNSVECWGDNRFRQLDVPIGLTAKQITLGYLYTCALKLDNTVKCWGDNSFGQANPPVGITAKQIVASQDYACALKLDNTAQCWGNDLGDATNVPSDLIAKQL